MATTEELEKAKKEIAKLQRLVETTEKNTEAAEKEIKRLLREKVSREENVEELKDHSYKERVVYVTQSHKLERFKGKPEKTSDLKVEDWIEDAKAACVSKNLDAREQAAFLIEHLGGDARREVTGRGEAVSGDPNKIYAVLLRVFGDGASLAQLQQQFYSYRQREGEDLVACSLKLVKLFDRITQLDPSFLPGRDTQLKNRLAEAVVEDCLRTELRRLNAEHPEISFFDARDRVMQLMTSQDSSKTPSNVKREATVNEVSADNDIRHLLKEQSQQIAAQQKQIESLLAAMKAKGAPQVRKCWLCDSTQHIKRNCPKNTESGGSKVIPSAHDKDQLNNQSPRQ